MSKKETNKYLIPVEVVKRHPHKWLDVKTYEYKLYADSSETKATRIKFIDINGFIIGEHMPTKLHTVYDKAAMQVKSNAVKAVSEIKNVVGEVAGIAAAAAGEVKGDVSKMSQTAKQTAGFAVGIFGKLKSFAQEKLKKEETVSTEPSKVEEPIKDTVIETLN